MTLDDKIHDAVLEATQSLGQNDDLAHKLLAWLEALASGNETLEDRDNVQRHLELLYEATQVSDNNER